MSARHQQGFTLIEIMITVAILAIIASVALPSYQAYVSRSRIPSALDALSSYATRMEQTYQDAGRYDPSVAGTCTPSLPSINNFSFSCSISNSGQGYIATATGTGSMAGYTYTINNVGTRATTAHPKGTNTTCWSLKGSSCDS